MRDAAQAGRALRLATGLLLAALPAVRILTGGPGWDAALAAGQPMLVAVDLGMVLAGAAFLYSLRGPRSERASSAQLEPAE